MDWYSVGMEKVAFWGTAIKGISSFGRSLGKGVRALPRAAKNLTVPANKVSPWQLARQAAGQQSTYWNRTKAFAGSLRDSATRGLGKDRLQGLRDLGRAGKYTAYTGGGLYLGNKAFGSRRNAAEMNAQYLPPRPSQYYNNFPG